MLNRNKNRFKITSQVKGIIFNFQDGMAFCQ